VINELAPGTAAANSNIGGNFSMAGANIGITGSAATANGRISGFNNPSFA